MCLSSDHPSVSLGFTRNPVPRGTHLCLIFTSEDERVDSLRKFIRSGLEGGERVACFSDRFPEADLETYLAEHGIQCCDHRSRGDLHLRGTREVYFEENRFVPDRMLRALDDFYQESKSQGYAGARIIGEMTPEIETVPGGDRLLEYECRVSMMLEAHPLIAVCQYDATAFDGATILEVLKVHPKMIVNGAVVENPFFVPPREYLEANGISPA